MKEKHLNNNNNNNDDDDQNGGKKNNKKFYLKTFKHKTNGTRIKQVVVGNEAEVGIDSVRKVNTNMKKMANVNQLNGMKGDINTIDKDSL